MNVRKVLLTPLLWVWVARQGSYHQISKPKPPFQSPSCASPCLGDPAISPPPQATPLRLAESARSKLHSPSPTRSPPRTSASLQAFASPPPTTSTACPSPGSTSDAACGAAEMRTPPGVRGVVLERQSFVVLSGRYGCISVACENAWLQVPRMRCVFTFRRPP